nr:MAG TPA: hypothetical protein [Caudoviricetes sp.]
MGNLYRFSNIKILKKMSKDVKCRKEEVCYERRNYKHRG